LRLVDSPNDPNDELYNRGFESGYEWATHRAGFEELNTLEGMWQELGTHWRDFFYPKERNGRGPAYRLMIVIHPGSSREDTATHHEIRQAILQFVDNDLDLDQPAFVHGFADGALSLWAKIKAEF